MYEVGIAHAVRLPEEVILFRSDKDQLLFDVASVRVNFYAPDSEPDRAKELVSDTILEVLRELDLRRSLAVKRAVESLDEPSLWVLVEAQGDASIAHPRTETTGQALGNASRVAAIRTLLDIGAIRASFLNVTADQYERLRDTPDKQLLTYQSTKLGRAIFDEVVSQIGLLEPKLREILERNFLDGRAT